MEEKLKPCPFCGSTRITSTNVEGGIVLGCLNCYCCGPLKTKLKSAIAAWNKRS